MSHSLVRLLFVFITFSSLAQDELKKWNSYLEAPSDSSPYFLTPLGKVDRKSVQVIRRLDEDFAIVCLAKGAVRSKDMIPVNDRWKLNLSSMGSKEKFYVKMDDVMGIDLLENVETISHFHTVYLVQTNLGTIEKSILPHPAVTYVGNESVDVRPEARVIDMNLNPNRVNKLHHFYPSLDGSGETVSIQENQFDEEDIDLLGRSIATYLGSESKDNHATEMATIIAGAGNSFVTGRGVVKDANITSSDFSDVLPDADEDYQSLGIAIQNHSYGTEIESFYGVQAQAFDQSSFINKGLLHIFSSGNQGSGSSATGQYAGIPNYANLTGNFKMAKNVLVVGAIDTTGNEVSFVSRGPAYDGRVKPEVVAYSMFGSSNSAALVSGISSVLQQQHKLMNASPMPSALTKALLINGAEDVGSPGLDFVTGYGSVNAFRSLKMLEERRIFSGSVVEGEVAQFVLELPADAVNLKVTLSWTDLPSDVMAFKSLINDLDLKLISASAEEVLPWVLDSTPTLNDLSANAFRGIDRINNNEQVTIAKPYENSYTVEVAGFEVTGSQDFFIVYEYDLEGQFEWDYPTGSDNMPYNGESGSYFRWQSTLGETTALLELSIDEGATWQTLDSNVELAKGYWRWENIPDFKSDAKVRMTVGTQNFETETFTISTPLDVSVGFVCSDSLRLQWESVEAVAEYEIFTMGDQVLEFFQTTSDTALTIGNIGELTDNRFSVVPVLPTDQQLMSSITLDYTRQGIECFIFSFFQEVVLDTGIYLNLRLGTVYGIEKLTFERGSGATTSVVSAIDKPSAAEYRVLDSDPKQGNNTHRVVIDFINGARVEREVGNTYYLTELPLLVFPNPVVSSESLNVLTKELETEDPRFKIFDARGVQVINYPLQSTQGIIPLDGLEVGVYFYRLEDGSGSYSGRLVVR